MSEGPTLAATLKLHALTNEESMATCVTDLTNGSRRALKISAETKGGASLVPRVTLASYFSHELSVRLLSPWFVLTLLSAPENNLRWKSFITYLLHNIWWFPSRMWVFILLHHTLDCLFKSQEAHFKLRIPLDCSIWDGVAWKFTFVYTLRFA